VVLLAAGLCAGDDKKDDKDLLQGQWVIVSANLRGKEADRLKGGKLVVKGDEWILTGPAQEPKVKFKLDASTNPKQLDLTRGELTRPGIYKIDGDTLTFCRSLVEGGDRPTEFKGGPGVALMVYKRAEKK
jgi:uncharacterized protein (TIGR03067 family)